jgi:hypothetical protein
MCEHVLSRVTDTAWRAHNIIVRSSCGAQVIEDDRSQLDERG